MTMQKIRNTMKKSFQTPILACIIELKCLIPHKDYIKYFIVLASAFSRRKTRKALDADLSRIISREKEKERERGANSAK